MSDIDESDEIEELRDHRIMMGIVQYKVHWKGTTDEDDEWFDRTDLIAEFPKIVNDYEVNNHDLNEISPFLKTGGRIVTKTASFMETNQQLSMTRTSSSEIGRETSISNSPSRKNVNANVSPDIMKNLKDDSTTIPRMKRHRNNAFPDINNDDDGVNIDASLLHASKKNSAEGSAFIRYGLMGSTKKIIRNKEKIN